jgi:hypothetical protein
LDNADRLFLSRYDDANTWSESIDENHETMSVIEVYGGALGLMQLKNESRIGSADRCWRRHRGRKPGAESWRQAYAIE